MKDHQWYDIKFYIKRDGTNIKIENVIISEATDDNKKT